MKSKILFVIFSLFLINAVYSQGFRSTGAPVRKNVFEGQVLDPAALSVNHLDQVEAGNSKYNHPLKKVGKILVFAGLPVLVLGSVMVASSDALYYECVNGECTGDPLGGFGITFMTLGLASTTTGGILWAIGADKSSK
jgi:hypothetical protein